MKDTGLLTQGIWSIPRSHCGSFLFPQSICTTTTAFLHFFFLASFCWVLTEAWQSYMAVTGKIRTRLIRKRFLCLGWGKHTNTPFVLLLKWLCTYIMRLWRVIISRLLFPMSNLICRSGDIRGWSFLNILWTFGTWKSSTYCMTMCLVS